MKRLIKYYLFVASLTFTLFSCTTKEDKVREYVEQDVVSEAEEYLIYQAIVNYVQNEALEVFTERITYYANNPYYDYSYFERDLGGPFMALASASGGIKELFDERWNKFCELYTELAFSNFDHVEYEMYEEDTTFKFKNLPKENCPYSLDNIADVYFKPNHLKFTEITPELYKTIFHSMLCLGAATYKYDVVDDIRVRELEKNLWSVDIVYHSGYCLNLKIQYCKGCFYKWGYFKGEFHTLTAPWIVDYV